ncbi:MAG: hypothetical protein V5B36_06655 [Candidatus Accumulibacter sp. UW25]|jgi:hypothetical protein
MTEALQFAEDRLQGIRGQPVDLVAHAGELVDLPRPVPPALARQAA